MEVQNHISGGRFFAGRYEIVELLGRGSRGLVYRARDRELNNQQVALKLLVNESIAGPKALRQLRREVLYAREIKSPYVVQIFEFSFGKESPPFIVLECVEGGNLRDRLRKAEFAAIPIEERFELFRQVCLGVQAAHEAGIVHRDIKPENILLTSNGTPKITDFGFARLLHTEYTLTQTEETIGTPLYMAPEQFQGRPGGVQSDIYSLGILAFEMCTGKPPYREESFMALGASHIKKPFPVEELRECNVPPWLESLIARATVKAPTQRQQSLNEIIRELEMHSPGTLLNASREHAGELLKLQRAAARFRTKRKLDRYATRNIRYGIPAFICFLILCTNLLHRAAGNATYIIFPVEKYFGLNLSPLSKLFSVPWSVRRPEDLFRIIEAANDAKSRKALVAWAQTGIADDVYNESGDTPLSYAARLGVPDAVGVLLMAGMDPLKRNKQGETPLSLAFKSASVDTVASLGQQLPLERCDEHGDNPIQFAIINRQFEMARILANMDYLNVGDSHEDANPGTRSPVGISRVLSFKNDLNQTALHLIVLRDVRNDGAELLTTLLLRGANQNVRDNDGKTPMMLSIEKEKFELALILLASGSGLTEKNGSLVWAPLEPVRFIPDVQDAEGQTALMLLIEAHRYSEKSLQLMLEMFGFEPNFEIRNSKGETALGRAITRGWLEAARVLIQHGAKCTLLNADGESAVSVAEKTGHSAIVAFLKTGVCERGGVS